MEVASLFKAKGSLLLYLNINKRSLEAELITEGINLQASIILEDLPNCYHIWLDHTCDHPAYII